MNNPTHTPGPWRIGKYEEVEDTNGQSIRVHGMTLTSSDLAKANARLIAAAPELLAFCEKLKRNGGFYGSCIELNVHEGDKLDGYELLKELDELIKKATTP